MRTSSIIVPLFALGGLASLAQDDVKARIAANLERSASVASIEQDSLNGVIKADLRTLLDRPGAINSSYADLAMTKVEAPDGAFKLFTWNLPRTDGTHLFEGFLLTRTPQGQALYELRDMTRKIAAPEVPELGPEKWYGALYYDVVPVKKGGRTYYTLLGWKGYSKAETRKVIEVLSFKGGKPRFGAPIFSSTKNSGSRIKPMRRVFGYAFSVTMTLKYDPALEAIIMDHLSPHRPDLKDQWAFYGPDMTHDGYFWHKGEWWFGPEIDLREPENTKPGKALDHQKR